MADVESYSVTPASNTGEFPEGQAPSTVNDGGRQVQADVKQAHNRINGDITAGGTADALTATFSPAHTSHVAGRVLVITAAYANATTTPTFTLDALAAKTITKNGGQALVAGDIYGAGHEMILKDAGTYYELMNPATSTNIAGVTSTVAELNILDGVTATATELNVLDNDVTNQALNLNKGSDIASATTTDIGAATGNFVDITGTTTITGLGTVKAGTKRIVQFDGSLTLTYNATSLILPGNADIVTQAGDVAEFISLGSGNWMMTNYLSESTIPLIETGTWTPTIQDLSYSDGEGQTYTTQEGNYIKIGKTVFITGYLKISSLGTLSTRVILAGLPFTASSTPSYIAGTIHIGYGQALSVTAGQSITCAVDTGTTRATLWLWQSTTGSTAMSPTQLTGLGELAFSGQYLID